MALHDDHDPREDRPGSDYEPPRIERLGSLADLTLGGTTGPDDGYDGAGDEGSL